MKPSLEVELPARRAAWLADTAYQTRLTEQARTLAAAQEQVTPVQLRLSAADMPDTAENARLAEYDEVRVRFAFQVAEGQRDRGRSGSNYDRRSTE